MPAMVCFFSCLACRYPQFEPAYLTADNTMLCWEGRHVYLAAVAAGLIVATFTTQMFIVTMRAPLRVTLYRLDALYEAPFLVCKTAVVAAGVLLRHKWGGRGIIYPMLVISGGLLHFAFVNQPVRGRGMRINNLRTTVFTLQLLGAGVAVRIPTPTLPSLRRLGGSARTSIQAASGDSAPTLIAWLLSACRASYPSHPPLVCSPHHQAMLIEFGSEGSQVRSLLSGGYMLAVIPVTYFAWLVNSSHPLNTGVPQKSLRRILGAMAEAATAAAPLPTDPPQVLNMKRQLAIEYGKLNHGRLEYREKLTVQIPCSSVLTSALRPTARRFRHGQRRISFATESDSGRDNFQPSLPTVPHMRWGNPSSRCLRLVLRE